MCFYIIIILYDGTIYNSEEKRKDSRPVSKSINSEYKTIISVNTQEET